MPNAEQLQRLPGGRMPTNIVMAAYFFGPLLKEEFSRFHYALARAAKGSDDESASGVGAPAGVLPARLSYVRMAELLAIQLPPELTIAAYKAAGRKGDGSFEFKFHRRAFSRLNETLTHDTSDAGLKLRRAILSEDHSLLWQTLFAENFGHGYQVLPAYKSLMSGLATVAAGVELMIYQAWADGSISILRDSPQIFQNLDLDAVGKLAIQCKVSPGVALAAVIQLGARKTSPAIRAGLEKGNWDPLHEALWAVLIPDYKAHPFFKNFLSKLENPKARLGRGRPPESPLGPIIAPGPTPPSLQPGTPTSNPSTSSETTSSPAAKGAQAEPDESGQTSTEKLSAPTPKSEPLAPPQPKSPQPAAVPLFGKVERL